MKRQNLMDQISFQVDGSIYQHNLSMISESTRYAVESHCWVFEDIIPLWSILELRNYNGLY